MCGLDRFVERVVGVVEGSYFGGGELGIFIELAAGEWASRDLVWTEVGCGSAWEAGVSEGVEKNTGGNGKGGQRCCH